MDDVLKIIYDCSTNNRILTNSEIEKITILLIEKNNFNTYITNIDFDNIGNSGLALYNINLNNITIYSKVVEKMINNIEKDLLIKDCFQKRLYENLSIIQIILHELEHVNQNKKILKENNFESFIIRLGNMINIDNNDELYETSPIERLAEIKSYKEILNTVLPIRNKIGEITNLLNSELLKRNISGYHYKNNEVIYPLLTYFTYGNKKCLLESINMNNKKDLDYRFQYGMQINLDEYKSSLKRLIYFQNKYYNNKIMVK